MMALPQGETIMRLKWFFGIVIPLTLSGCFKFSYVGLSEARMNERDYQAALLETLVPITATDLASSKASAKVTQHPFSRLRAEPSCKHLTSKPFLSTYSYKKTLLALVNRAASAGANALATSNWKELPGRTYAVGHFFSCTTKKYI